MLYTGKGDNGTTKTFGCDQKISKSSDVAEALGTLDEVNSFLGIVKVKASLSGFKTGGQKIEQIVDVIQQNLFMIQAEVAGAHMCIKEEKLRECEALVNGIEKELPPIKTFFVSGGSEIAALFDFARTLSRRAERRVVSVADNGMKLGAWTLPYLNRLSSLLYALARISNHYSGIEEVTPTYL